jgi:ADP-ribose pyrophosphatase YjhB (NUDIX family)
MLVHVSTVITNSEGQILFVREAKAIHRGKWNLPGGHVEEGEHLREAAIREVKEESELDVTLSDKVRVIDGISPTLHSLRVIFFAESYRGTPQAGDEILELRWIPAEELLAMPDDALVGPPFLRAIVQDILKGEKLVLREIRIG